MKQGIANNIQDVKDLQYKLKLVLNRNMTIDGDYGPSTKQSVIDFQKMSNLTQTGEADTNTLIKLSNTYNTLYVSNSNLLTLGKTRFVVFVDAGHGGINDKGEYTTSGKRAYHKSIPLHERGHYYEGYENRLVAEEFIEQMTTLGIMCIRTYHPFKDTSLSERTELIRAYLKRGYIGYMHSFHSNAISETENSAAKLESTIGYMIYNTKGNTFSDEIATEHYNNVRKYLPNRYLRTEKEDGDVDYESNFQILRETDLSEFAKFGAILEEWGFHTSAVDCQFIVTSRNERVKACVDTALWVRNKMIK